MECGIIYISFDLETLGGNPLFLPIFNAGFVAYTEDRQKVGELSVNMKTGDDNAIITPGMVNDREYVEKAREWFQSTPENRATWEKCTKDPVDPQVGMQTIRDWIMSFANNKNTPLLVASPTIFDGSLLYYYWFRFLGHPSKGIGPGFGAIDVRSYGAGRLGIKYFEALPKKAFLPFQPQQLNTHYGLDDAEEQMQLFFNLKDGRKIN